MFTTGDKKRSCKKVFDLDFQGHAIKIEFFSLSPLDSLTPKNIPMRNIFKKFGREGKNPGGWYPPPLGRPKVDFYLGHLRVNFYLIPNQLSNSTYKHYSSI